MSTVFGPYSPYRQAGGFTYISGQVGVNMDTKQAPASVEEQTSQALMNLGDVLHKAGLQPQDVLKTTIYVTNMADFGKVNAVYEQFFPAPRPARATVGVAALPAVGGHNPILVEIEAVAYKEQP